MKYPKTLSEEETLAQVLAGRSIGRYGDGEYRIAHRNAAIKSQAPDEKLSARLRSILLGNVSKNCLIGIPNVHSETPKRALWDKYRWASQMLSAKVEYASSFITRPDSAPWINTPAYWAQVESLWKGQDVTLVRGSGKSLTAELLTGAGRVTEIMGPRQNAWASYDELLERIGTPARALICLGPTATVMAVDLCKRGVHAIDLGHIGLFLKKRYSGIAMQITNEDRAVDCA